MRSQRFKRAHLKVGAAISNTEEMPEMVYQSAHGGYAGVFVQKAGQQLRAWNVACPPQQ